MGHKYKFEYQEICDHFLSPLSSVLLCQPPPYMSEQDQEVIKELGDRYVT